MITLATSAILAAAGTTAALPRSTPDKEGVDPAGVLAFVGALEKDDLETHGFMLVRNGRVVAEGWWKPSTPKDKHVLYSLSKSFMSTALGLAVSRGKLSLDDKVSKFFPDDMPKDPSQNLKDMCVKDLLTMTCGQETEPMEQMFGAPDGNMTRAFLAHPVPFRPGTHFLYNTAGSYMLSAIVQKATGQTLSQILSETVYKALGIDGAVWDQSAQHVDFGGFGLHASTEDIAKFGQLYLNGGVWGGRRVLPENWVIQATRKQVENGTDPNNDWNQGYGYQFWMCRNGAFRGDGAFGQFCLVMPKQNAVLAITGGGGDMGRTLNAVWTHLLPAFDRKPAGRVALSRKLRSLALPYPKGEATSVTAQKVSGETYLANLAAGPVQRVRFDFLSRRVKLTMSNGAVYIGLGGWLESSSVVNGGEPQDVYARGAWTSPDTFTAKIVGKAATWSLTYTARFDGNRLTLDAKVRGAFGPAELPRFEGKGMGKE